MIVSVIISVVVFVDYYDGDDADIDVVAKVIGDTHSVDDIIDVVGCTDFV